MGPREAKQRLYSKGRHCLTKVTTYWMGKMYVSIHLLTEVLEDATHKSLMHVGTQKLRQRHAQDLCKFKPDRVAARRRRNGHRVHL